MGEDRILDTVRSHLGRSTETIVDAVLALARDFEATARDDRTILALRI